MLVLVCLCAVGVACDLLWLVCDWCVCVIVVCVVVGCVYIVIVCVGAYGIVFRWW